MHRWSPSLAIILVASAVLTAGAANAQSAFRGPPKILVGFAAGGSSDIAARMLADKLKDTLGQPVVVENRVGAGGRIAAEALKNAPPDGATLLLTPVVVPVLAPLVFKELNYDPAKDFAPVSQVATYQFAFAVAPTHPARTVPEFIAWLKANPTQANFGSPQRPVQPPIKASGSGRLFREIRRGNFFHEPLRSYFASHSLN